jgi:hypothetical protein
MDNTKQWYQSKTVWASLGTFIVIIVRAIWGDSAPEGVLGGIAGLGAALAAGFRVTATKEITTKSKGPPSMNGRGIKTPMGMGLVCVMAILLAGCAGPVTRSSVDGFDTENMDANVATSTDDAWHSSFYGATPWNAVFDAEGYEVQAGGQHTGMGMSLGDARIFLSNPANTAFDSLRAEFPDGTTLVMTGFATDKSSVISAYDNQVISALQVQGYITEQQAKTIESMMATGKSLGEALITVLGGL